MQGSAAKESVLFIGAGKMGRPMATHLLEAGISLSVADHSPVARKPFEERGIVTAERSADLSGEIVITSLPTDAHVRDALLGEGGALTKRKRGVVIDMTSASPSATKALAVELAQRGIPMIDAPVSGGPHRARTAELTTMVGGDVATFERYRPLLGLMCSNVRHVGPIGSGHTLKALNNFLSGV